jgi:hypothetical protein
VTGTWQRWTFWEMSATSDSAVCRQSDNRCADVATRIPSQQRYGQLLVDRRPLPTQRRTRY